MKKSITILIAAYSFIFCALKAQNINLVINGSFENIEFPPKGPGEYKKATGVSSANNTSVDLYSVQSFSRDYSVPDNYMGSQLSQGGSNYVGIVAFYADESGGLFKTTPGYMQYSEYVQFELSAPLTEGRPYTVNFNISLAERSAYAVAGLGAYLSSEKLDIQNNSFLSITPNLIACDLVTSADWETVTGTYLAKGGEKFLTLGCFKICMDTVKVIPELTDNSRKAYYYMDEVSVIAEDKPKDEISSVFYGNCFLLEELSFETDKSTILPESYMQLRELAYFLRTYPALAVYIDGHTNQTGTIENTDILSEERAQEVKRYLVAAGVKADQLKTRGFGSSAPIDITDHTSAKNERVEITVCITE